MFVNYRDILAMWSKLIADQKRKLFDDWDSLVRYRLDVPLYHNGVCNPYSGVDGKGNSKDILGANGYLAGEKKLIINNNS